MKRYKKHKRKKEKSKKNKVEIKYCHLSEDLVKTIKNESLSSDTFFIGIMIKIITVSDRIKFTVVVFIEHWARITRKNCSNL